jgi:hypothetical protein
VSTLDEVNGSVPVKAMIEVLESDWAREQAWTTVEGGRVYQRVLDQGVTMTVRVSDLGQVHVTRSVHGERVEEGSAEEAVRERQRWVLEATAEQAQRVRGEVVARTMIRSLEIAQAEMNLTHLGPPVISVQGTHYIYESRLQLELPA